MEDFAWLPATGDMSVPLDNNFDSTVPAYGPGSMGNPLADPGYYPDPFGYNEPAATPVNFNYLPQAASNDVPLISPEFGKTVMDEPDRAAAARQAIEAREREQEEERKRREMMEAEQQTFLDQLYRYLSPANARLLRGKK